MKVLPSPGSLWIRISPPRSRVICRLIERPEPGAAVLAAGAGIALLESLEDDAVLLLGDADAGVADGKATTALAALSSSCSGFHPPVASAALSDTAPAR